MEPTRRVRRVHLILAVLTVLGGTARAQRAAEPDPAGRECEYGVTLAFLGRLAAAESVFTSVLSRSPRDARALNNLGNLAILRDEPGLALRYYERAATADTADAGIVLNQATAYLLLGNQAEATARAKIGVTRAGGPAAAARLLGLRYQESAARAGQHAAVGQDEILGLLRAAIAKVPADSANSAAPDTARTRPGRRPVVRSAGARAGALADLTTQLDWKQ